MAQPEPRIGAIDITRLYLRRAALGTVTDPSSAVLAMPEPHSAAKRPTARPGTRSSGTQAAPAPRALGF